jgi:hypothetical protein
MSDISIESTRYDEWVARWLLSVPARCGFQPRSPRLGSTSFGWDARPTMLRYRWLLTGSLQQGSVLSSRLQRI